MNWWDSKWFAEWLRYARNRAILLLAFSSIAMAQVVTSEPANPIEAPTLVWLDRNTNPGKLKVGLTWTFSRKFKAFVIIRRAGTPEAVKLYEDNPKPVKGSPNTFEWTDKNADATTTYVYTVAALTTGGLSAESNPIVIAPNPTQPSK